MPESYANHGRPPTPAAHAVNATDLPANVDHALCAYAEPWIGGRRGLVVGSATSGVGERLLALGARSVHLFDRDPVRAAQAAPARGLTVRHLDERALDFREGAFEFALVLELAEIPSAGSFLSQLRRLVDRSGAVLVRTVDAGAGGVEYGELFDLVSLEFPHVKMVGEVPFGGVAFAELGAEAPEVSVDSQLAEPASPRAYVALATHEPRSLEGYAIVQLPGRVGASDEHQELAAAQVSASAAEVERLRAHIEVLRDTLDREGEKGMRLAMELEVAQKALRDAEHQAAARIAEAMQASQEASVALQARLAADLEGQLRAAQVDLTSRFEEAEAQLLVQDAQIVRLSKDLIDAKNRLDLPRASPKAAEEQASRIASLEAELAEARRLASEAERRVADAGRRLAEIEGRLADADKRVADADKRVADADKRVVEAEKSVAEAASRVAKADKHVGELKRLLGEAEQRATVAEGRVAKAERYVVELERIAARAELHPQELAAALHRADVAERRAHDLAASGGASEARLAQLEEQALAAVADAEARVARAEELAARLRRNVADAEARAARTEKHASEAETRATHLERLVSESEGRVAALREAAERLAQLEPELEQLGAEHVREVSSLEEQLLDRARMLKAQDVELVRRARMVEDLLSALEEAQHGAAAPALALAHLVERPSHDDARVLELRHQLDELARECARREGELEARSWRIQELELERELLARELAARAERAAREPAEAAPAAPHQEPAPTEASPPVDATIERLEAELFALRQGFVQEHAARVAAESGEALAAAREELEQKTFLLEELERRLAARGSRVEGS